MVHAAGTPGPEAMGLAPIIGTSSQELAAEPNEGTLFGGLGWGGGTYRKKTDSRTLPGSTTPCIKSHKT